MFYITFVATILINFAIVLKNVTAYVYNVAKTNHFCTKYVVCGNNKWSENYDYNCVVEFGRNVILHPSGAVQGEPDGLCRRQECRHDVFTQ